MHLTIQSRISSAQLYGNFPFFEDPKISLRNSAGFEKKVSEYNQEIPQSQTTGRAFNHHETPGRQIKQSNQLSLPHQDDCNTRMDIK